RYDFSTIASDQKPQAFHRSAKPALGSAHRLGTATLAAAAATIHRFGPGHLSALIVSNFLARPIPRVFHAGAQAAVNGFDDAGFAVFDDETASFGAGEQGRDHVLFGEFAAGNNLAQIKSGGIESGVGVERVAFSLECGTRPDMITGG